MKKIFKVLTAAAIAATLVCGTLAFSACGNDEYTITVGASSTPHAEILENAVAPILKEEGYKLKVKVYEDYVLPNTALYDGSLDANYFQHNQYLEEFNEEYNYNLVAVAQVHYEPFSIYAGGKYGTTDSLENLASNSKVLVPNDATNEARALNLLASAGLIEIDSSVAYNQVTKQDITSNPKSLDITEVEAAACANLIADAAISVVNGNYALQYDLTGKGYSVLATEKATDEHVTAYVNVIAARPDNKDSDKIQALVNAVLSDSVKTYIEETYNGAVVAVF
ncbi:MAG: MetQ/NlpA family ABC transporter substrate-binding protein [Clostridia bacterium]|nr:MetQ/NlpA family ABC transporter substrate-binding protein [Clostridia bacterium]